MSHLTPRQTEILALLRAHMEQHGWPPTRSEIAQALQFKSPNAAEEHLRALERKGVIELIPGASRGIRLLNEPEEGLPLVGRVAAGSPILAEENVEQRYGIDPGVFAPRADYLLRVKGMSMRDAGILDGDLLAVHRTPEAANGQIVVARIDNEVTVKRLQRRGSQLRLLPENPDFEPIEINPRNQSLTIEGISVGVLRIQGRQK